MPVGGGVSGFVRKHAQRVVLKVHMTMIQERMSRRFFTDQCAAVGVLSVKISQPRNMQNGWLSRQRCSGSSKLLWHTPGRCVLHRSKFHPDLAVSAIPQAAFSIAPARPQDVKEAQRVLLNERLASGAAASQGCQCAAGHSGGGTHRIPPLAHALLGHGAQCTQRHYISCVPRVHLIDQV